jgi:hypothetical protein
LPGTNTLAYYGQKKFYNIGPRTRREEKWPKGKIKFQNALAYSCSVFSLIQGAYH